MAETRDHLADVGVVFVHGDWLGTERARSSASGVICQTETSLPFGNDAVVTGGCTVASPDFLTGKPRDAETGLDDFGARYLSSQWGRWMSADWTAGASAVPYATLTNPQSLNLYAYVGNDPVDGMDPDGHARYDHGADGCAAYVSSCSAGGDYSDWASMALVDEQIYGHDLAATGGYYAVSAPNGGAFVGETPASVISAAAAGQEGGQQRDNIQTASGPVNPDPQNFSQTSENYMPWEMRGAALELIDSNSECSAWLNSGGGNAHELMSTVEILLYKPTMGATNYGGFTSSRPNSPISVSSSGPFYARSGQTLVGAPYKAGTYGARITILLHELAHQLNIPGFVDDGSLSDLSGVKSANNTKLLLQHCIF